jgi:hypothetical protein
MGATYPIALFVHSWLRWAVLIGLLLVVVRSWTGRRTGVWSALDERIHVAVVGIVDLQFLVGLWLYFLASPFSRAFLADLGTGMHERGLRFFGLEHATMMLLAVVFVHLGRARAKKLADGARRHRTVALWTALALLFVLSSIPWPFGPTPRPLFRFTPGP